MRKISWPFRCCLSASRWQHYSDCWTWYWLTRNTRNYTHIYLKMILKLSVEWYLQWKSHYFNANFRIAVYRDTIKRILFNPFGWKLRRFGCDWRGGNRTEKLLNLQISNHIWSLLCYISAQYTKINSHERFWQLVRSCSSEHGSRLAWILSRHLDTLRRKTDSSVDIFGTASSALTWNYVSEGTGRPPTL